jgi:hypothetical protein
MALRHVTWWGATVIRGSGEREFELESLIFSHFHSLMAVGMSLWRLPSVQDFVGCWIYWQRQLPPSISNRILYWNNVLFLFLGMSRCRDNSRIGPIIRLPFLYFIWNVHQDLSTLTQSVRLDKLAFDDVRP